jgi:hypothetical protein
LLLLNNLLVQLVHDPQIADTQAVASHLERSKKQSATLMDNCDIWVSAEKGDVLGILQCLQPWRPPPTARGAYKRTALHWACSAGHSLATAFLLPFFTSAPPRPELQICKDVHGNTPLHLAVNNSHVKCVQAILQSTQLAQTWMHTTNYAGHCPLQLAQSKQIRDLLMDALGLSSCNLRGSKTCSCPLTVPDGTDIQNPEALCSADWSDWTKVQSTFTFKHLRGLYRAHYSEEAAFQVRTVLGVEAWKPAGHLWMFPEQQRRLFVFLLAWHRLFFVPEDLLWEIFAFVRNE